MRLGAVELVGEGVDEGAILSRISQHLWNSVRLVPITRSMVPLSLGRGGSIQTAMPLAWHRRSNSAKNSDPQSTWMVLTGNGISRASILGKSTSSRAAVR